MVKEPLFDVPVARMVVCVAGKLFVLKNFQKKEYKGIHGRLGGCHFPT